jgi:hypothetical protein
VYSICAVFVLTPAAVRAATFYVAEVYGDNGVRGDNGFAPVSVAAGGTACGGHGWACAGAGATADLFISAGGFADSWHYAAGAGGFASASFSGYEVLLSGPSGGTTTTSLNLTFTGVASLTLHELAGSASVTIGTDSSGPNGAATDAGSIGTTSSGQAPTGSGLLSGWTAGAPFSFSTSPFTVDAGDVITVGLNLVGSSGCGAPQFMTDSFCHSEFDVQGFSFATTGPVFNLPAGWTANSVDGTIVNNGFVPEPSTASLVALGLLGLGGWRRVRAR